MSEVELLTNMKAENWISFIIIAFATFFLAIAILKGYQFLAAYFGWESKEERRFKALEVKQAELIAENNKLKAEISEAEKRCKDAIGEIKTEFKSEIQATEQKFDDREHEHWEESKVIKGDMDSKLDMILQKLEKQESLDFKNLRHSIVKAGESYVNRGSVKIRELRSLEELYEEYTDTYDGNSYVETLMTKVRALNVIGKLNEHGEDIE